MIQKILYIPISNDVCSSERAASSYWNDTMMDVLPEKYINDFEQFEIEQINMKNEAISEEIKKYDDIHLDLDHSSIVLSSMRDEVVVLCDIRGES